MGPATISLRALFDFPGVEDIMLRDGVLLILLNTHDIERDRELVARLGFHDGDFELVPAGSPYGYDLRQAAGTRQRVKPSLGYSNTLEVPAPNGNEGKGKK